MPHLTNTTSIALDSANEPISNDNLVDDADDIQSGLYEVSQIIRRVVQLKRSVEHIAELLAEELRKPNSLESYKSNLKFGLVEDTNWIVREITDARQFIRINLSTSMKAAIKIQQENIAKQSLLAHIDLGEVCDYDRLSKNLVLFAKMLLDELCLVHSFFAYKENQIFGEY
jgi:hypothetical protein